MYKRINITLDDQLLAEADRFGREHRFTRSGLIAAALRSRMAEDSEVAANPPSPRAGEYAEEPVATYGASVRDREGAICARIAKTALRAFFSARSDVEAAWLFGSMARGTAGVMSDVDVAVLPAGDLDAAERWALRADLGGRLESALERRVDVGVVGDMSIVLAHRALVQGVRVLGDESARAAEAEISAAKAYWESESLRRQRDERLSERLGIDAAR